jgi:surface antigen
MIASSKRAVIGILLALALVAGMTGLSVVSATVEAAPAAAKTPKAPMSQAKWNCYKKYSKACITRFGYTGKSAWGYPKDKYGNNCTNYAAFRLSKDKKKNPGNLGNANQWASSAKKKGLTVGKTPKVGSIAQWNGPGYGHVAYVDWVSSVGKTVYVSESGYGVPGLASMSGRSVLRKGKKNLGPDAHLGWPSNFVTFKKASSKPAAPKAATGKIMVKTQKMSKATLKSTQKGWYAKGSKLTLKCYVRGQKVKGYYSKSFKGGWDDLWCKVSDGYYAADVDLNTGSNKPITKKC